MGWRRRPAAWLACALLALLFYACVAPLRAPSREKLFELGRTGSMVPTVLRLTLGVQDVLLLHNGSRSAQVFGQLRVLPGHVFRLPFEQVGDFDFACSAHAHGQMRVHVVAPPRSRTGPPALASCGAGRDTALFAIHRAAR